jgi:hypothetical protein
LATLDNERGILILFETGRIRFVCKEVVYASISEETCNFVRASAASRGFFQEGNESLADLFARSLAISCRELKAALKTRAAAVPVAAERCAPGRRRR